MRLVWQWTREEGRKWDSLMETGIEMSEFTRGNNMRMA